MMRNSSVGIVTWRSARQPRNRWSISLRGKEYFSFPKTVDWLWSSTVITAISLRAKRPNTRIIQQPRLRMSGSMFLLPLCAFMECTRTHIHWSFP